MKILNLDLDSPSSTTYQATTILESISRPRIDPRARGPASESIHARVWILSLRSIISSSDRFTESPARPIVQLLCRLVRSPSSSNPSISSSSCAGCFSSSRARRLLQYLEAGHRPIAKSSPRRRQDVSSSRARRPARRLI